MFSVYGMFLSDILKALTGESYRIFEWMFTFSWQMYVSKARPKYLGLSVLKGKTVP